MTVDYKLTQNEYLDAIELHQKRGLRNIMMIIYGGMAIVFVLTGTDFSDTRQVISNLFILFFAIGFYILITRLLSTYQNKKLYEKSSTLSKEVKLRISGRGIKIDEQEKSIPWDTFSKWKENEDFYLLYRSIGNFKIIPKRAMSEQEQEEFSSYVEKHLQKSK